MLVGAPSAPDPVSTETSIYHAAVQPLLFCNLDCTQGPMPQDSVVEALRYLMDRPCSTALRVCPAS